MTLNTDWSELLSSEKEQAYFRTLMAFIDRERSNGKTIYPAQADVFNAIALTPLAQTRVVILGQDPYHGPNQAHGLAFSVNAGVPLPPSLRNIFKELQTDLGITPPQSGNLSAWAKQGVLLLNTVLTVEQGLAHSHKNQGWETFTDAIIKKLSAHADHIVFLLWGSHAQKKSQLIDSQKHTLLMAPHPSPLSAHRGFFGCRPFSQANAALRAHGQAPIDWSRLA
ncbi:MAG: uracil-DNA glycosylase [Gammaproteobacteria bacterium]|nr:uracil-DNA glycosylase [Gammaproteobacteria bacterium]